MTNTILADEPVKPRRSPPDAVLTRAVVGPFTVFGLVLTLVGLVDMWFAWWPLHLGAGEWEFGIASRTFDSLALGSTGFVLLVVGAAAAGRDRTLMVLSGLAMLACLLLLGILVLYGLNAPVALGAVAQETLPALKQSMVRTTCFAVLYIGFYGWLGWYTWHLGAAPRKVTVS